MDVFIVKDCQSLLKFEMVIAIAYLFSMKWATQRKKKSRSLDFILS